MIDEARQLLKKFQEVHLHFLEIASTVTDEEPSAETGDCILPGLKKALERIRAS